MSTGVTWRARSSWWPGVLVGAFALCLPALFSVPVLDILRFVLALGWIVLVPGVVLLRLTYGRSGTLLGELLGAYVVGMVALLVARFVLVGIGLGPGLVVYPVVLVALVAAVPRWRRTLRPVRYPGRMPTGPAWALAGALAFVLTREAMPFMRGAHLPPRTGEWYVDLTWHAALAGELTRSAVPQVPQVAGETLRYHWFADAQMAALSLGSGLDVLVVTLRLWLLPTYAVALGLAYLLTRRLARSAWAGALAAWCLALPVSAGLLRAVEGVGEDGLDPMSPSQVLGLSAMLAACWLLVDVARSTLPRRGWLLLALLLLACAGAKSSILPTLAAGLLGTLALLLIGRRPWRQCAGALALVLVLLALTAAWLAGGSAASRLGPATISTAMPGAGDHGGLWTGVVAGLTVLALILQKAQAATVLLAGTTRRDPAVWLLGGCVVAGLAASFLIDHPGRSQTYFVLGVLPLVAVLAAWGLSACWRAAGARAVRRSRQQWARLVAAPAVVGGVLVGLLTALASLHLGTGPTADLVSLALPAVLLLGVTAAAASAIRHRRASGEQLAADVLALQIAVGLLSAALLPSLLAGGRYVADRAGAGVPARHLTVAQVAGTTWLREGTPDNAVVATNVHRRDPQGLPDYRAFWVGALTQRRQLVGAWGYTDQTHSAHGRTGLPGSAQPFHDPALLRLNDAAFTTPSRAGLDALYARGARWLFADASAGPVSPDLRRFSDRVFADGGIQVFRLRPPR